MDAENAPAEQDTAEMRQDIDDTRTAMADKLEALEDRVMVSVHSAQETVEDSIKMAKDTVATVKRNFDITYQVEQHPWAVVGGCFVAGLALGGLFRRVRPPSRQAQNRLGENGTAITGSPPSLAGPHGQDRFDTPPLPLRSYARDVNRRGFFDQFHEEIDKVKGMAVGYVMGLARDSIKDAVPQLASQIDDVMNSATTKLGSKPAQPR